jgi:hypothetical protein
MRLAGLAILSFLLLAGCGLSRSEKRLVGVWELDHDALIATVRAEIEKDPRVQSAAAQAILEPMLEKLREVHATVELKDDRRYVATGNGFGRSEKSQGRWHAEGDQITLEKPDGREESGEKEYTGKVAAGVMRFELEKDGRRFTISLNRKSDTAHSAPR